MTVPGKGERPRKWRSDADRVRAFRARQRGEDEPATIEGALEQGDEAAAAWDRVRELGKTIETLRSELKSAQAAQRRAEHELDQERVRFGWISEDNDRLRAQADDITCERDEWQERFDALRRSAESAPVRLRPPSAGPNRAQRRREERERRRPT